MSQSELHIEEIGLSPLRRSRVRRGRKALHMALLSFIILSTSVAIYPLLPRYYLGNADLLLRPTNQEGATTWDQSIRDALDDNAIQTKLDILRSEPLQMSVIQKHNLLADPEFNPLLHPSTLRRLVADYPVLSAWLPERRSPEQLVEAALLKHIVVKREKKSYLMQVGFESVDPHKAAELTNTLVDGFIGDQVGRKVRSHQEILDSLSGRVKVLEAHYHRNEQIEHDFAVGSGVIESSRKVAMQSQIAALSTAIADAHRRTIETANRAGLLAKLEKSGLDSSNDALSSVLLQRLRERYVEFSSGAGVGNTPSGSNQSILTQLRQGIEAETLRLVKAAQGEAFVAGQNELALRVEVARLGDALVKWGENERRLYELHRSVETDLAAIAQANARYMQEAGRGDVLQPDIEVVSQSGVPDLPAFPNPLLYAAGTAALVLVGNFLLLMPQLRRRFGSVTHV